MDIIIMESHNICWYPFIYLILVVQKVDNVIHWLNHYPVESVVCSRNSCPLDNNLWIVLSNFQTRFQALKII